MKKLSKYLILLCVIFAGTTLLLLHAAPAHAFSFNQNDIIDDGHFDNANTMNAGQINAWLNANFPSSCISPNNGFTSPDPTGYTPSVGFTYGANVSSGQVIADAAQAYGVNPEVLLATLQKESSVVTGDASYHCQYINTAMGYGCPDSGSCPTNPATMSGFSKQVIHAAWLMKFGEQRSEGNTGWDVQKTNSPQSGDVWNNSDDPLTCYGGPMTQGSFKRCSSDSSPVFYDGSYTIDGTAIQISTGATAALYWYTPHFSGNQNFDNIYNGWFGPPTGVDYSWSYVSSAISGNSWSVTGNSKYTVTLVAKNTGNQAWTNTNYPVRLATFSPTNHTSPLYDSSWYSPTRPATLNESVVAPGSNGTFTFVIDVPNNVSGNYTEHFNLVAEGASWMPDAGYALQLNVSPSVYSWQMVSQSSTNGFGLAPGQTSTLTLVAKNTGNVTWSNSTNPVRLATWYSTDRSSPFDDGSWIDPTRAATLSQSSVAPGQNGTFTFTIKAPSTPGSYHERFNLVMEGVSWFDDPWMEFDITVGHFYTWQMVSQSSTNGFALHPGQMSVLTLVAKNTGNVTWTNSNNPVRLSTWYPTNRNSPFCSDDTNWIVGCYRAAALQESSIAPGQNGTFVFTVQAPAKKGFYSERYNLVMEGISWFVDPWMEFDITVT